MSASASSGRAAGNADASAHPATPRAIAMSASMPGKRTASPSIEIQDARPVWRGRLFRQDRRRPARPQKLTTLGGSVINAHWRQWRRPSLCEIASSKEMISTIWRTGLPYRQKRLRAASPPGVSGIRSTSPIGSTQRRYRARRADIVFDKIVPGLLHRRRAACKVGGMLVFGFAEAGPTSSSASGTPTTPPPFVVWKQDGKLLRSSGACRSMIMSSAKFTRTRLLEADGRCAGMV